MNEAPERVSLYRVHSSGHAQWACTIEADEADPNGYRIIDLDPNVVGSAFFDRLNQHMRGPVEGSFSDERAGGIIVSGVQTFYPGDPEHFGTAARTVQFAHIGPTPESR